MLVENLIKSGKATIVDVRTPDEFLFGNVKGSINIPLNTIENNFSKLKTCNNQLYYAAHRALGAAWQQICCNEMVLKKCIMVARGFM